MLFRMTVASKSTPHQTETKELMFVRHYCQVQKTEMVTCVCGILSENSLSLAEAEVLRAIPVMQWWSAALLFNGLASVHTSLCGMRARETFFCE